ncbi:acetyltransferase, partial [Salmonella enterica subsp. enterica serovar Typhimurium]|nr:acetyltransferase [Salmonella enterica subsp. enterica serovar Typhimurium]
TLPPQGEPGMSVVTQANLQRLSEHIRQRLNGPVTVTCHPHRVGLSSCVAVTVEGRLRRAVNILMTVSGQGSWPAEEEYEHPRWYITVTDAADMVYLVLWLNSLIVH